MPNFRWIEIESSGKLAISPHPAGHDSLETDLKKLRSNGVDVLVSMLGREESEYLGLKEEPVVCAKVGLEFIQAPIIDRSIPETASNIYRVAMLIGDRLTTGQNVVVHCRMGIGRASVMAACVMALRGIEPSDAFELITQARGIQVPDTLSQKLWVESFAATFSSPERTP